MTYNSLKIVWRTLLKSKATSVINLVGLTIGLATAFLIGLYVFNELQTDSSFPLQDRTYRVLRIADIQEEPYRIGITSGPFAGALKQDFPSDIEEAVRVMPWNNLVEVDEKRYQEDQYYYVDAAFLDFFGYSLLVGDLTTALVEPNSVVLTRETARKYFGDELAAVGKTLRIDNDYDAIVTGVLDDQEIPTHFDFDLLESTASLEGQSFWSSWWNNSLCTYIRLHEGISEAGLEARLPQFMDKYFGEDFARIGRRMELDLQPLSAVYFEADTRYDPMLHGNKRALRVFLIAALLLVVIACFNYVNLSTAKAVERSLEIGVYKALGAGRGQIMMQMLAESTVLAGLSVAAAAGLAWYIRPWFETAFEVSLDLLLPAWQLIPLFIVSIVALALLAGMYPGWLLSSFDIISAMKKSSKVGERGIPGVRKTLVVFQFALSVGLIIGTVVIQRQLSFLQEKDLGFDREQVVLMRANNPEMFAERETFRNLLKQEPGVLNVSLGSGYPGGFHDATVIDFVGVEEQIRMRTAFVDFDYVDTFGLEVIAGRSFSEALASDSTDVLLLNERAVAELGMTVDEVVGMSGRLPMFDNQPRTVVGVIEDYHFTSLHSEIEPLVISTRFQERVIAVKAQADRLPAVIAAAEEAWNDLSPAYPFQYEFLDERLDQLYTSEIRQGRLFAFFGGVAIFIACLGMFGLIAFVSALRAKEIGIRKVLGASVADIVTLLSKDFLLQVCVAILVATPIAFLLMQQWLESFAYRISLGVDVFVLSGLLAVLVALATVSFQSIRAALSNPVETLRCD